MTMTDISAFLSATAGSSEGTLRWMSPELLAPDDFGSNGRPTRESDCYALGMVIYEVSRLHISRRSLIYTFQVLTGLTPFYNMPGVTFILPVLRGRRPEKPPHAETLGFSDALWELVQSCWSATSSSRPTARELLEQFSLDSPGWVPPMEYPVAVINASGAANSDSSGSSQGSLASWTGKLWVARLLRCFLFMSSPSSLFGVFAS